MTNDWTGIEVDLTRFIGLCKTIERTDAKTVQFLRDGTIYLEAAKGGDYAFVLDAVVTDEATSIPSRELRATYRLLGLWRDNLRTVKGQAIRIGRETITILPAGSTYRRRLTAFAMSEAIESRLSNLARFTPEPNIRLTPRPQTTHIRGGATGVTLTLGDVIEHHTLQHARITGTTELRGTLRVKDRAAKSFFALCEQDAAKNGCEIEGRLSEGILFLRSKDILTRIRTHIETRNPT